MENTRQRRENGREIIRCGFNGKLRILLIETTEDEILALQNQPEINVMIFVPSGTEEHA